MTIRKLNLHDPRDAGLAAEHAISIAAGKALVFELPASQPSMNRERKVMNILVTGGAGYLGSVLVPKLLANGHHVSVLDSFRHGVPSLPSHNRLEIEAGDVRETDRLGPLVEAADAVVHLAALVGPVCELNRGTAISTNLWATEILIDLLRDDQPLVFPCTNSGYGKGGILPVTEDAPMTPLSLYGRTKVDAETTVLKHPLGVSLRFGTLYGTSPRMRLDLLVNDFTHKAMSGDPLAVYEPEFRRCVLHVSDAAEAIALALENPKDLAGRPWNVGAENVTKTALCEAIRRHIPALSWFVANGQDPDQRDYDVSWQAFHTAVGWGPQRTLDAGIQSLIRLYRQPFNGPWWRNA